MKNSAPKELVYAWYVPVLMFVLLSACSGGGNRNSHAGNGSGQSILHTSLSASASDILAGQIAVGSADQLTAMMINTDSPSISLFTNRTALDSFLAKHPIDQFEMLSSADNQHVRLAWLARASGNLGFGQGLLTVPDFSPDTQIAPNGRFFCGASPRQSSLPSHPDRRYLLIFRLFGNVAAVLKTALR